MCNKTTFVLTPMKVEQKPGQPQYITLNPNEFDEILKNHPDAYIKVVDSNGEEIVTVPVRPAVELMQYAKV